MAVTFNPSIRGSNQFPAVSYLDTQLNEIRMNTSRFPSGLLVHWADNCFNLKNLPNFLSLSEQVRWQVFFAAFGYFDPTSGPQLGSFNGGQFFVDPLSPQDLAVLYRIIYSYHMQYEKSHFGDKTVFQKHLTIIENRFKSSSAMTKESLEALEVFNDPTLRDLTSRLKDHLVPRTQNPYSKVILSNTSNSVIAKFGDVQVQVMIGDALKCGADAVVNAANMHLRAGSGICGAIYKQGGSGIFDECEAYLKQTGKLFLEIGGAMITSGGTLPAKHVIHAVGPFWSDNTTEAQTKLCKELLYNAYMNSLKCATLNHVRSIAFPSISTGAFHFPMELAAPIAMQAFKDFAETHQNSSLKTITLALGTSAMGPYRRSLLEI